MSATSDSFPQLVDPPSDVDLARLVIESQARYYEAGARMIPFEGGTLALVRGEENHPLEAVVQRIRPAAIRSPVGTWLEAIEHRFRSLEAPVARILMDTPAYHVDIALRERGWTEHPLVAFVAGTDRTPDRKTRADLAPFVGHRFVLNAVESEEDWVRVGALQGQDDQRRQLDRRRADAGAGHPYLVWHEGRLCGTFSVAPAGPLLRLERLTVDALPNQDGLSHAVLDAALDLARQGGWRHAGCLLRPDEGKKDPWRREGFRPAGRVSEWRLALERPASFARAS